MDKIIKIRKANFNLSQLKKAATICGVLKPETNSSSILGTLLTFLFLFGNVDYVMILVIMTASVGAIDIRVALFTSMSCILQILAWFALRMSGESILKLLHLFKKMNYNYINQYSEAEYKKTTIMIYSSFVVPALYFVLFCSISTEESRAEHGLLLMYSIKVEDAYLRDACFFIKYFILNNVTLIYNIFMLVLYIICCRCMVFYLTQFLGDLERAFATSTFIAREKVMAENYISLLDGLKMMQQSFSKSSFYYCFSLLFFIFSGTADFLVSTHSVIANANYSIQFIVDVLFFVVIDLINLIAMYYIAGEIPLKMKEIKNLFDREHARMKLRLSYGDERFKNSVLKELMEMPVIILSGSNVLFFTKANLFSILGAAFTYGLITLTIEKN